MTSKLKKAIGVIKDQTSVSLAFLNAHSTTLEVAVLKATSHDEVPVHDRYSTEVLLLASSSPTTAASIAIALQRRLSKTSSWIVALKTLTLIYNTIIDSGPDFRREAAMRRLLDLSSFRSSPWDFTAFVRTYALYLDARLQSSLQGYISLRRRRKRHNNLKPAMMLDRIQHWQQLLDRAVGTRPTGPAKANRLVQASLRCVIRESFDLYRDIAGGMSILLDNFFQLPYPTRVSTVEACRKTAKLFEDLEEFYTLCKNMGVGRDSEYPIVQKISKKLLERLNELLKDNQDPGDSTSAAKNSSSPLKLLHAPPAESERGKVVEKSREDSLDMGQGKLDAEHSLPTPSSMPRRSTTNPRPSPFLDDNVGVANGKEKEEEKGTGNAFQKSAWIQNRLDDGARQQLIKEQQRWVRHQDKIKKTNLALQ